MQHNVRVKINTIFYNLNRWVRQSKEHYYIMHNSQTNFLIGVWTYWVSEFSTQNTVAPRPRHSGESCWADVGLLEMLKSPEKGSKDCLCLGLCFNFLCRSEETNC